MEARPGPAISATTLGAVAGLCVALLLQQAGVLPLDRLAAFGLPAVGALVVLVAVTVRTGFARSATEIVAIVVVVLLLVVAVTGVPALAADGELGGGSGMLTGPCAAEARSDLEAWRSVTAMSRANPFDIDPDGSVSWEATSTVPITDHTWRVWVDVAGFRLPIDDDGDDNTGLSQENFGSRDVQQDADRLATAVGGDLAGIYLVGGDIAGTGGSCVGQAWIRFEGGAMSNAVGQTSLGLLVVVLVLIFFLLVRAGRTVTDRMVNDAVRTRRERGDLPLDGPP